MDTLIEQAGTRRWNIVTDDGEGAVLALVHEGSDGGDPYTLLAAGQKPSPLADLDGRRYPSLSRLAQAVGAHLKGACLT